MRLLPCLLFHLNDRLTIKTPFKANSPHVDVSRLDFIALSLMSSSSLIIVPTSGLLSSSQPSTLTIFFFWVFYRNLCWWPCGSLHKSNRLLKLWWGDSLVVWEMVCSDVISGQQIQNQKIIRPPVWISNDAVLDGSTNTFGGYRIIVSLDTSSYLMLLPRMDFVVVEIYGSRSFIPLRVIIAIEVFFFNMAQNYF